MLVEINESALLARLGLIEGRLSALEVPKPVVSRMQLGAISYYYPGAKWDALLKHRPAVVIINPASGPGTAPISHYVAQVTEARAAGARVFGYVWTSYGRRSLADVRAEMHRYSLYYGIKDIFLDEASNKAEGLPYYTTACAEIHTTGGKVALNPGTTTLEDYFKIADHVMCFEGTHTTFNATARPTWEQNYPGKPWHAIHSCPAASMSSMVYSSYITGAGLVWVTDDVMTNPYDSNPTYLDKLAAEVAQYG